MTKILVVDDEPEIRSLLGAVLQAKGFEVVTGADGAVALEQVQREHPSVILLVERLRPLRPEMQVALHPEAVQPRRSRPQGARAIDGSGVHGHHR